MRRGARPGTDGQKCALGSGRRGKRGLGEGRWGGKCGLGARRGKSCKEMASSSGGKDGIVFR